MCIGNFSLRSRQKQFIYYFFLYISQLPVPVAAPSKAWVCGRSPAEIVGLNPTGGVWIFVCCECRVLSGRGLCDELITRPEESYRLRCVVVCDLETSRICTPYICIYIFDFSSLRVKLQNCCGVLYYSMDVAVLRRVIVCYVMASDKHTLL